MLMIFDKLEDVPESLRSQAKEVEGKFHLEGNGLVTKNKELLGELQQFKDVAAKLKEFEGMDPKKAKEALAELTSIQDRKAALDGEVQKAVTLAAADWERKVKATETERDAIRGALEERIVDADLNDSISKAEGNPLFVAHHLKPQVKVVSEKGKYLAKVVDAEGKPRFNAKGEPMTIAELVDEAKADKRFEPAFKAPEARGSGAQAGAAQQNQGGGKVVTLTRDQAKDAQQYRAAMKLAGDDASRIVVKD